MIAEKVSTPKITSKQEANLINKKDNVNKNSVKKTQKSPSSDDSSIIFIDREPSVDPKTMKKQSIFNDPSTKYEIILNWKPLQPLMIVMHEKDRLVK